MESGTSERAELQRFSSFGESRIPEITGFSSDGTQFGSLRQVWATQLADGELQLHCIICGNALCSATMQCNRCTSNALGLGLCNQPSRQMLLIARISSGTRMHSLTGRSEEHTSELQSLMRIS